MQRMRIGCPRGGKKSICHAWLNVFNSGGVPFWRVVFVNSQSAYAFHSFANHARAKIKAVMHHVALHTQVVSQSHAACSSNLLQRHMQHQR